MPLMEFKQGSIICNAGEPLRHLYFITKGTAESSFNGHVLRFEQGDTVGLYAIGTGTHTGTCTAVSDITAFSYVFDDFESLESLMRETADVANLFVISMCRQISKYMQLRAALKTEADKVYKMISEAYPLYERLCDMYAFSPKKLPAAENIVNAADSDPVAEWLSNFYMDIRGSEPAVIKSFFRKPGISIGFLHQCIIDISLAMNACKLYQDYLRNISWVFLSGSGLDLFTLISELHVGVQNIKGADAAVGKVLNPLISLMSSMTYIDKDNFEKRLAAYNEVLGETKQNQAMSDMPSASGPKQNLADSLSVILEYSGCSQEMTSKFSRLVSDYTKLRDRGSSEDAAHHMRRELTGMFNEIYSLVLTKSLKDPALPTIIKMFLNFGYVDSTLAGHENADFLYSIADSLNGTPEAGIYTLREWMAAIYQGRREPSRNEFDMDFEAYVAEQKQQRKITDAEAAALLQDRGAKLRFEMENLFPVVNKLTFGRITVFCPLFSDNNVQRGLEASLVTPELVKSTIDEIRRIDFSAYYRETAYTNPEIGINRESVHVEVLPEIILMPNVGVRGVMWQEIEGRKRTTPARMFMPIFLITDLKALLVILTGEFRWEMCKRVQGVRWNDITDASLTSEYCDYLQFYRTNRELSPEIKASIKTELSRARNNWRGVFVQNYLEWITFESSGSPRLNKYARKIMSMYCPFSLAIRETVSQNPQFAEHFKRYSFKLQQREQLLSRMIDKLSRSVHDVPQELVGELEYVKK